jgi:protein TonB
MLKPALMFLAVFISFLSIVYSTVKGARYGDITIASSDTTVYDSVDVAASFPGGKMAWLRYLQKNLNPTVPIDNGADKGKYPVVIKFIVTSEGALKDFKPETNFGYGMEDEIVRILKLSPNWIPAKRNGIDVSSFVRQTQTFAIDVK